ncbi:MAG: HTTM domain-containing protein [Pirellulales bacterium]
MITSLPRHDEAGMTPRGWLTEWSAAWNAFWFTPADPLPLAVIRIVTGAILAWSCVVWLLDADAFFGDRGWLRPDQVWRINDQPWQWSLYFTASSPTMIRAVAGIALVAAILLTLGLAAPLAAGVSFVCLVSAANRAPLNVFGLDDTLGMLLVPLVVGPSGARLSVDRLLFGAGRGRGGEASVRANVALRLLQVHLCVVYLFSGAGKLFGASWWEGTALWGAVANDRYRTLDLRGLAGHPLLVNALTLATLWWEVAYPALVWPRLTRRLFLAMAVAVHLGIGLAMGMMEFGLAMITANLAFVPAAVFERLLRRPGRSASSPTPRSSPAPR